MIDHRSSTTSLLVIVWPKRSYWGVFTFIAAGLSCHFRVSLDMMSVQANTGPRWENKSSLAFWRGRDSRQERLDLVRMSRRHPDIIDARLTRMFFFKHTPDLGETVDPVSFFDFFKVNYICELLRLRPFPASWLHCLYCLQLWLKDILT